VHSGLVIGQAPASPSHSSQESSIQFPHSGAGHWHVIIALHEGTVVKQFGSVDGSAGQLSIQQQ